MELITKLYFRDFIIQSEEDLGFDVFNSFSDITSELDDYDKKILSSNLIDCFSSALLNFTRENEEVFRNVELKKTALRLVNIYNNYNLLRDPYNILRLTKNCRKIYMQLSLCYTEDKTTMKEIILLIEDFFDTLEIHLSGEYKNIISSKYYIGDIYNEVKTSYKSDSWYKTLVEQASDGIFIIDKTGNILGSNTEGCKILGFSKRELSKLNAYDLINPNSLTASSNAFKKIISGRCTMYDSSLRHKEGYFITVEINSKLLPDGNIQSIVRDISGRKRIENTLKESEERYKTLLKLIPDCICIYDENGILYINKAGVRLLGATTYKDLIGTSLLNYIHPENHKEIKKIFNSLSTHNLITDSIHEEKLIKLDGSIVYIETKRTFFNYKGKNAIISVARDITYHKEAEKNAKLLAETVAYDKLKTEFFSNISHELKTPINVILSTLQLMEMYDKQNLLFENRDKLRKYGGIARQNSYRLIRLVNNLIDITKIDAGYLNMNLKNHDIVNLVEDITLSVTEYAANNGINILFDTNVEEKIIACDSDKIERIILNLISNAIKFTNPGGEILVTVNFHGTNVTISVKDNGIGIPKNKQELIFERFIQVDKSLSRNNEGSGIGLSLVKSLVEMHEGTISVNSDLNKGSEFIIVLPCKIVNSTEVCVGNNCAPQTNIEKINIEFSDIYPKD